MRSRSPNDLIGGPAQYPLPSSVFLFERRKILILEQAMNEQDRRIAETIERERGRLQRFIESRVPDRWDAEDILQDVFDELDAALDELPEEQRLAFVANELEGRSFRELAAETGVPLNTLLARKHTAVRHLRRRLQSIYDDFKER